MREARSAGSNAATTVTRMPTVKAPITADAGTPMLSSGSCEPPMWPNTYASSAPTPTPAPSPRTEASTPITTASTSTEPIICRRLAPTARIRASSLVRCAMMIENVLRIRKTPTNSATPAKPSRMLLKKPSAVRALPACSSCNCLAVRTW